MPAIDIPSLGTAVLCAVLVAAGYAFATAVASGRGRLQSSLPAARNAAYATCALVALSVLLLAYSFQAHDFRPALRRALQRSLDALVVPGDVAVGRPGWLAVVVVFPGVGLDGPGHALAQVSLPRAATLRAGHAHEYHWLLRAADAVRGKPFSVSAANVPLDGEG